MKCSLACLLVLGLATEATAADNKTAPMVLPGIVYRNYVFFHYRDYAIRDKPYLIVVGQLDSRTTIIYDVLGGSPRNAFESLFVRGRVLVLGANEYSEVTTQGGHSRDRVNYLSPEGLGNAKWIAVEPTGEPHRADGISGIGHCCMWVRMITLGWPGSGPAEAEIVHTAVAAAGDRDLLAFDLVRTDAIEGKPTPLPRVAITRIIPEERAQTGGGGILLVAKPEVKPAGEMPAAFDEPFQAYVIGDDYYFLTKSGSVYRSPPAEKGKLRTMAAIWDNKKQPPVRFILSDGNKSGVHFLIYHRAKLDWEYFQFAPEPKPQLLTDNGPNETEKPAQAVIDLARVLRDKKLIVTPTKKQ